MGRRPRGAAPAEASVKLRLTAEEHARFSAAALAAGYRMPRTEEHPEPRGAIGAWMRSLADGATAPEP